MKTRNINIIALAGILALNVACQSEDLLLPVTDAGKDGYKTIAFVTDVPAMDIIQTKAVDPDGGGVQNITVFCFDANDLFITTVNAKLTKDSGDPSLSGKFTVSVPNQTVTMQLVGNQNLTYFREDNYRGMSEVEVMSSLEASAGRMIYWARKTVTELEAHNSPSNPVQLLRNQAKITLSVDASKTDFQHSGWVVVNTNAFGTVAPYNPDNGGFVAPSESVPFVTIPENTAKLGDFLDVRNNTEEYIFETENSEADPIDFIVKGSQGGGPELYYRISLIDRNGNNVMIMRNHHYTVNITGDLYYGQESFEDALNAPATNNVWVSISDNISEVMDSEYRLAVDETFVIIGEDEFRSPNEYYLHYTYESLGGGALTEPSVSWMDGNNVALSSFGHTMDDSGRGTIVISLNEMGDLQKREGTLFIKAGRLSRKIKVITVKEQTFEPAWITTNIYGVNTGENVTMMFTIPDDCPQELLPMDVLVTVNDMDVRNESKMRLPVIRESDPGYGEPNDVGYKYVLNVTETGVQCLYLETIMEHVQTDVIEVTIEAPYFKSLTKPATFRHETDYSIIVDNLRYYTAAIPEDEVIFYYLVPQKTGAEVNLETHLAEGAEWNTATHQYDYTPVDPHADDEFLFYSRNLDHNDDPSHDHYFEFTPVNEDSWGTGGRVHSFSRTSLAPTASKGAVFNMKTNTPKSAEVVRIASNPASSGNQYRSVVFELSNYHPFHFGAQVNGTGTLVTGENKDEEETIMLSYLPDQTVNIDIDVTSFTSTIRGNDDQVLPADQQVSVDPFGVAFDIYIDAPMLKLDETSPLVASGKLRKHETVEGRFVYSVAADRAVEAGHGFATAAIEDSKAASGAQNGERKRLAFKTKSIVSAGKITISSDESKVVFYKKTFNVLNSSITGTLQIRKDGVVEDIPAGSFVPFEVLPTYNRIGTVTVGTAGEYELRLRSEYKYDWDTDKVKFQYVDKATGVVYEKEFATLKALYSSTGPIILEPQTTI